NKAILDNQTYIFRIYTVKESSNSNKIPYYFYIKEDGNKVIKKKGYYGSGLILYKTLSHKVVEGDYYEWIRFNNTATARGGTVALARAGPDVKKYSITVNQLG
ncbi:MAG: prepilin-type cleavage/methylation domain-containing protein, partial [Halanaerobium sp.]